MKRLHCEYQMSLGFSQPVGEHHISWHMRPLDNEAQRLLNYEIMVLPDIHLSLQQDGFGNPVLTGDLADKITGLMVNVTGLVETSGAQEPGDRFDWSYCRQQTELTRPGEAVKALADVLTGQAFQDDMEAALAFMHLVHERIAYAPGSTTLQTTAEEAAAQEKGVCQDQTHILLSLCRMQGMIARYVAGMMEGEGQTHAWAEVLVNGYWIGLDPTHNILVEDRHVALAHGRDSRDCLINRGIFRGFALQTQQVTCRVWKETEQ